MDTELEIKLILCLDALEAGEPIEAILARYPADAAALRPLLETALALPALALEPERTAQVNSRRAFLNQAAELRAVPARSFFGLRLGMALATLVLALVVAGGGTVAASASALPGDLLYGVKRAAEQVQVKLARDKSQVAQEIAEQRRREIESLIALNRSAEAIDFSGQVATISIDTWQVGGLTVQVDAQTQIDPAAQPGADVTVLGRVDGQTIHATAIRLTAGGAPTPSAPAPAQPAPTHTATSAPTSTVAPTSTQVPAPTATALPTATAIPEPSPTALRPLAPRQPVHTPIPTVEPIPPPPPVEPPPVEPSPAPPPANPNDDTGTNSNDGSGGNPQDGGDDNGGGGDNGNDSHNDDEDSNDDGGGDDNGGGGEDDRGGGSDDKGDD